MQKMSGIYLLRMILSENRFPLFGMMRYRSPSNIGRLASPAKAMMT
jgi:hypothetical protein